jgi:hypothetical protein
VGHERIERDLGPLLPMPTTPSSGNAGDTLAGGAGKDAARD